MKPTHRVVIVFALLMVLVLAVGVGQALAASEAEPGYNATVPPASTGSGDAIVLPAYIPGWWWCSGLTSPSSYRFEHLYDFSADAWGSMPTAFPGGNLTGISYVAAIGNGWMTWNPQVLGKHVCVVYNAGGVTIRFDSPQGVVGVVAEPNSFTKHAVTIEGYDSKGALIGCFTRNIVGLSGAAFLGLWSPTANIQTVKVYAESSAYGFAFSDLQWGAIPRGNPRGHTRY